MANIVPYALTTRQKVKDSLNILDTKSDSLIDTLVNSATAFIENYCGGRRFKSTSYVEVKDTYENSNTLFMNQKPATAVSLVEFRSGTISVPVWNTYTPNGYYTYLTQGYLKFTAKFRAMPQAYRITYVAGYLIDFDNEIDPTKHTLPFDLTQVCTELITKKLNTRFSQGISQESTEGQSVAYETDRYILNDDHKVILNAYKLNRIAP